MDKKAESMAYKAGYALPRVTFPEEITSEHRALGLHHCPFAEGDPQRAAWARGLQDALTEQIADAKSRDSLLKALGQEAAR